MPRTRLSRDFENRAVSFINDNHSQARRLVGSMRNAANKRMLRAQFDLHDEVAQIQDQIDDEMHREVKTGGFFRWAIRIVLVILLVGGIYKLVTNHMELEKAKFKLDSTSKTTEKNLEQGAR